MIINRKPKVAISIGDMNGVGPKIAFDCHNILSEQFDIIYCANLFAMRQAANLLNTDLINKINIQNVSIDYDIEPKAISAKSGLASFDAFKKACDLAEQKDVDAIITLPIHKYAWKLAGITYAGHTQYLRYRYKTDTIMVLGCEKMFVGLYTDHIALKDIFKYIKLKPLTNFLENFATCIKADKIAVLGLNPHAGDGGVLGTEDFIIARAIEDINLKLSKRILYGPFPPDTAFTPKMRQEYQTFVAMTHDHGLSALKALYFDESINISLGLPIIRASVDHGVAFDIAYDQEPSSKSYLEAFRYVKKRLIHEIV